MDMETAQRVVEATTEFYARNAESFSSTRERPWDGWNKVLDAAAPAIGAAASEGLPFRVLDIGCGNMRFESLLESTFPEAVFEFHCVDNNATLCRSCAQVENARLQTLDAMNALMDGTLEGDLDAPPCNLAVAFGFMHHVPMPQWRAALLEALVNRTAPGGIAAASFWQFAKDEKMARKAKAATEEGCRRLGISLDENAGDYLLGWQGSTERLRYCHSFSDAEVDGLARVAESCGATLEADFAADGPNGKSNRYLVLRKL